MSVLILQTNDLWHSSPGFRKLFKLFTIGRFSSVCQLTPLVSYRYFGFRKESEGDLLNFLTEFRSSSHESFSDIFVTALNISKTFNEYDINLQVMNY